MARRARTRRRSGHRRRVIRVACESSQGAPHMKLFTSRVQAKKFMRVARKRGFYCEIERGWRSHSAEAAWI